jgi:hypothetical protein
MDFRRGKRFFALTDRNENLRLMIDLETRSHTSRLLKGISFFSFYKSIMLCPGSVAQLVRALL